MTHKTFVVAPEVDSALAESWPVVALESTVIAHGLPHPINIETAVRLEEIVRTAGATPATIALLDGVVHVGLTRQQLEYIGTSGEIHKLSRRDLAIAFAEKWDGATTVATTIWAANRAGIQVFATGGIGGVHRGTLPDISADLPELASTPMTVVCSGAKIVLDIAATREWLETWGVTVLGFQCDEMPAFYSRKSGLPVDSRVNSAAEAARVALARNDLGLNGAVLLTVPVPADAEVPAESLLLVLQEALLDAEVKRIVGRDLTPFLLSEMSRRSEGRTLRANIALLENNARVAAEVAIALVQG